MPVTQPGGDPVPESGAAILALRRLTGAGPDEYRIADATFWSDAHLAELLAGRISARLIQAQVDLLPSIDDGGHMVFVHGRVGFPGTLDLDTATVVNWGGQAIDDTTIYADGRIDFITNQATTVPLLSGLAYDLYGAGADLLTAWASAVKDRVDITEDGQSISRSQTYEQMLEQARELRARSVPGTVQLGRTDVRRGRRTRADAALRSWDRIVG